jgi:glyoxylase-like metal-dependent hydrolase (beta-lactamase superfamily II)
MVGEIHRFRVGQFDCTIIGDGGEPGNVEMVKGMFPTVAAENIEGAIEAGGNPIIFSINILHVQTPDGQVLIDTGTGSGNEQLLDSLAQAGIDRHKIDRIIITHGHGDHIGGIVNANGQLNFPNARYSLWQSEWEYWLEQAEKSDDPQNTARLNLLPIQERVDLIDHESEILPGMCVLAAPGHTIGHIALLLTSDGENLLHIVDAAHHPMQVIHTDWSPAFDTQPDLSAQTRRALFERAARENLLVMAYHFPFPGLGQVTQQADVMRWIVQQVIQ